MDEFSAFHSYQLTESFEIQVLSDKKRVDAHLKKEVDSIWRQQKKQRGATLFNGQLLNFIAFDGKKLVGSFVDYKLYIAQMIDPTLQIELSIQPVAISALTIAGSKLLVGRRASTLTNYPQHDELVPSGSIDLRFLSAERIDYRGQTVAELSEETAIEARAINEIKPLELVYDHQERIYDVCLGMRLKEESAEKSLLRSEEYEILSWLNEPSWHALITARHSVVPLSRYLLHRLAHNLIEV